MTGALLGAAPPLIIYAFLMDITLPASPPGRPRVDGRVERQGVT